jgi:hypothetical protein
MSPEARERSFDELVRGLASGSLSRRKALRLMGAALVGGTLASFGTGGVALADDECKRTGKKCRKDKQCCSGNCSSGTCAACPSGQVLCNGSCVSTSCSEGQIFDPSSCACVAQCRPNNSNCTSGNQCCSGFCTHNTGVCISVNIVQCFCQRASYADCQLIDCSDATALNQHCTGVCASFGDEFESVGCVPNGCGS